MLISETWWHHSGYKIQPYAGTIMRLQCICYIKKPPSAFVSLSTKVKPWPEVCICTSAVHRDHGAILRSCSGIILRLLVGVCLVCQRPSQLCLCCGCSVPGNPFEFPAVGATPAVPLSLLWSLQGKGAPFWWPPCTPMELWRHFPSCYLIFQNASVPTQLGFFSSQIRNGFSYCNVFTSLELGIVVFTYISLSQTYCCISEQECQ